MKSRKSFLQTMGLGLIWPAMGSLGNLDFSSKIPNGPVVKNASEGETYYVRENTPITIFLSKTDHVDSVSLCTEEILPGGGIPTHKHLHEDEFFFFLKGNASITIDGTEHKVRAGSTGFVPKATWHSIKNTGADLLIFTFGFSPGGFEEFFRQIGTIKGKPFKPKPQAEIMLMAEKFGMVYP
jgi:mannose-6-phosphate isomerase-like protein (cupin superfamily)